MALFTPRTVHPLIRSAFLLLCALATPSLPLAADDPNEPDKSDERLQVSAFVGEVLNNFASSARLNLAEEEGDRSNTALVAGFRFDMNIWDGSYVGDPNVSRGELWFYGEAIHSARNVEVPCDASGAADPNNPEEDECELTSSADPNGFFKIVRDSSTLEWLGGVQWNIWKFNELHDGEGDYQTAVYVKGQAGFIRASAAGDDLIDNHFYGIGLEQTEGTLAGSFFEVGGGKTDFFAPGDQDSRLKIGAGLFFTPIRQRQGSGDSGDTEEQNGEEENEEEKGKTQEAFVSYFVEGWLDSDRGKGSDDIQIYLGISLDVRDVFETLAKVR